MLGAVVLENSMLGAGRGAGGGGAGVWFPLL